MDAYFSSLKGKNVLITGSSRGIGRALAEGFAQNSANVAVHGVQNSVKMDNALKELSTCGTRIVDIYGDLSNPRIAQSLVEQTVSRLGGIDILVCNASIQIRSPWLAIREEDMLLQTQVNFFSTVKLMQQAVPYMQKNGWGRVITIGSTQQSKPHPEMLIYAAQKCAVRNVVQNLAIQLAPEHITLNNISVGTIYTDRNSQALENAQYHQKVKNDIPMRRIGVPADCVGTVLMLCSDAGSYVTGEDIHIDGGKFCF